MLTSFSFYTLAWAIFLILLTLGVVIFTYLIVLPQRRMARYKKDDVVTSFHPVLGFVKTMQDDLSTKGDILASAKEFSKKYPDKKIYVSNIGPSPVVLLRDAQYIKDFLQKQSFYKKADYAKNIEPLMGAGLVLAEGEVWKRHRKMISNSFHYEFLKLNTPIAQRTTQEFLENIDPKDYQGFEIMRRIQNITGEIVGRVFFGENLKEYKFEGKTLSAALAELMVDLAVASESALALFFGRKVLNLPIYPEYARVMKRVKAFRNVCNNIIEHKKADTNLNNDLLGCLIATQKSEDSSERFSNEEIIDEFITFFVAGMESTGQWVAMTLYNLSLHPQYLEQLKQEREATYNKDKEITADTLQKMDFLHAVLKETLRLYSPTPATFPRVVLEDHQLLDMKVKKGDNVRPDFFSLFYDEKYFEDSEMFKPSRWMNTEQKLDSYAFIPFSAGPRNCIGQHLAVIEAKVIVSEFLNRFEFKIAGDYKLRMTFHNFYKPVEPIKFHLTHKK